MDDDVGAFLAAPEAHVGFYLYVQRSGSYFVGYLSHHFFGCAQLAVDVLAYKAELFHWQESLLPLSLTSASVKNPQLELVNSRQSRLSLTLTNLVRPRKFVNEC